MEALNEERHAACWSETEPQLRIWLLLRMGLEPRPLRCAEDDVTEAGPEAGRYPLDETSRTPANK